MAYTTPGKTRERVFRFMRERLLEGAPPTVREVQAAMGFGAVESARKQLDALVGEGRLVKLAGRARGYRLPEDARGGVPVPLVGDIQAGDLTAAIESPDGYVVASRGSRSHDTDLFALKVRGLSMRDLGILPDDVVIVRRNVRCESGDVVVALIGEEATVKTLRRERDRVVLEPANPEFEPLRPDPAACEILGKVVELRRQL